MLPPTPRHLRAAVIPAGFLAPLLALAFPMILASCQGAQTPPIDRSTYPEIFQARDLALLTAVDQIEDDGQRAAAPWLLWLQRNEGRNLPERSRAAAALTRFGFDEGQAFCLAILGAWLPGHETESRSFGIPRSERMAFAREIAVASLGDRALEHGKPPPPYDVNQGAPQMAQSAQAWKKLLAALPRQAPPPANFADLYPKIAPREWTKTRELWSQLRTDLRDGYDPASVGTGSSPGHAPHR